MERGAGKLSRNQGVRQWKTKREMVMCEEGSEGEILEVVAVGVTERTSVELGHGAQTRIVGVEEL